MYFPLSDWMHKDDMFYNTATHLSHSFTIIKSHIQPLNSKETDNKMLPQELFFILFTPFTSSSCAATWHHPEEYSHRKGTTSVIFHLPWSYDNYIHGPIDQKFAPLTSGKNPISQWHVLQQCHQIITFMHTTKDPYTSTKF